MTDGRTEPLEPAADTGDEDLVDGAEDLPQTILEDDLAPDEFTATDLNADPAEDVPRAAMSRATTSRTTSTRRSPPKPRHRTRRSVVVDFGLQGFPPAPDGVDSLEHMAHILDVVPPEFTTVWIEDHLQLGDRPLLEGGRC